MIKRGDNIPISKIPGLVMHLVMNEKCGDTAFDNTRYDNDGSLGGGDADKMPVWSEHGLRFDGTDDYVDCGNDSGIINLDKFTLGAWIKAPASPINSWFAFLGTRKSAHGGYFFRRGAGESTLVFTTGGAAANQIQKDNVFDNNWHYIVGTCDGIVTKLYVDGEYIGEASGAAYIQSTNNFEMGRDSQNPTVYFTGTIDDPRIYNRALSAEITDLYNERRHLYV